MKPDVSAVAPVEAPSPEEGCAPISNPSDAPIPSPAARLSRLIRAQKLDRALHILVVDDQPALFDLLSEYFAHDWHTIETAADGREALQKFRIRPFDLIITDKSMPEMDGEELALAVKQLKPSQSIILLTGFGNLAAPGGKAPAGVDLILSKPVSLQVLREALLNVMLKGDSLSDEESS